MKIYSTDLKKLAVQWLPTQLRGKLMVVFASVMQRAGCTTLQDLVAHREETLTRLMYNGQVCYMRAVLNNRFDPEKRRITVKDVETKQLAMIYMRGSDNTFFLKNEHYILARRGFSGDGRYDFCVTFPYALNDDTRMQVCSVINEYKLASKRYIV